MLIIIVGINNNLVRVMTMMTMLWFTIVAHPGKFEFGMY